MMRVLPVVWRYAATAGFELSGDRVQTPSNHGSRLPAFTKHYGA